MNQNIFLYHSVATFVTDILGYSCFGSFNVYKRMQMNILTQSKTQRHKVKIINIQVFYSLDNSIVFV